MRGRGWARGAGRGGDGVDQLSRVEGFEQNAVVALLQSREDCGLFAREAGYEDGWNGFAQFGELAVDLDAREERHLQIEHQAIDARGARFLKRLLPGRSNDDLISVMGED